MLYGLVIVILCLLIIMGRFQRWKSYYIALDKWTDDRDKRIVAIFDALRLSTEAFRVHTDEEWGYAMGMPSKNSLQLVEVARQIEREHADYAKQIRPSLIALAEWEQENPLPEKPKTYELDIKRVPTLFTSMILHVLGEPH